MAAEKFYIGGVVKGEARVIVKHGLVCKPLVPRRDLLDLDHSGFAWGYPGQLPAQLGLAILCDALQEDERALRIFHAFTRKKIHRLPQSAGWVLNYNDIALVVAAIEDES